MISTQRSSQPRARRARKLPFVFGVVAAASVALGLALLAVAMLRAGREPTLVKRATRVTDTHDWNSLWLSPQAGANYRWLTNTSLVYLSEPMRGRPWVGGPVRLDLQTGARQPVSEAWRSAAPSPNGKWLLRLDKPSRGYAAVALAKPGQRPQRTLVWPGTETNGQIFWLPDSSGWVRLVWEGKRSRAILHPLAGAPRRTRTILFDGRERPLFPVSGHASGGAPVLLGVDWSGIGFGVAHGMMGFAAKAPRPFFPPAAGAGQARRAPAPFSVQWIVDGAGQGTDFSSWGNQLNLVEWHVLAPGVSPRRRVITPPPGVAEEQQLFVLPSPRGNRLLWVGRREYLPPFQAWLRGVFPRVGFQTRKQVRLWITNRDGSAPRPLGSLTFRQNAPAFPPQPYPPSPRWTPDGTRISFLHEGALWSVLAR